MTAERTCDLAPFVASVVAQKGDLESAASAVEILVAQLEIFLARFKQAVCEDLTEIVDECCGGSGPTDISFLDLTDTPSSYAGAGLRAVRVNVGETGLQFFTQLFTLLGDAPSSYSGFGGYLVTVNVAENALEFSAPSSVAGLFTPKMILIAHPDADGTGALIFGSGQPTTAGTIGFNNPISSAGQFVETYPRASMSTSAVAGQSSTWRTTTASIYRGDAARRGGFRVILRVGTQTALAQQRAFAGIKVPGSIGNVQPSTLTDCVGLAYDSAETTWRIQHNDSAGNCTRVDLGANFPVNNTALLELELTALPNGGDVDYTVTNLETGAQTSGTLSSDLPTNTTAMEVNFWVNNGTTAASAVMVWTFVYAEMGT